MKNRKFILKKESCLFSCQLPIIPIPKANRYRKSRKSNSLFLSKKDTANIEAVNFYLKTEKQKQKLKTITTDILLYCCFTLPTKRKRDIDNILKTLQDCLESVEIIKNDNQIQILIAEKKYEKNKELTQIEIYEIEK